LHVMRHWHPQSPNIMLIKQSQQSLIQVTQNGNQSRLTTCKSIAPLKLINPRTHNPYCSVILSGYGGGMVEGDHIDLQIQCDPNTTLYLGTQALTKIYKTPNNIPSTQTLTGSLDANACAAILPDPIVPFANSIFHQKQNWHLEPNACLILADSHTSGRRAFGEHFDYTQYISNITLSTPERPILIERYHSEPAIHKPNLTGTFGNYDVVFNLFIAGTPNEPRYTHLISSLQNTLAPHIQLPRTTGNTPHPPGDLLLSYSQAKPQLFVIRALSKNVESLTPLYQAIGNAIAHPSILNDNPLTRFSR
jgi:urease accessory protein